MRRADFERLVERTLAALPSPYAERLLNLVILVEDRADAETLAEVGYDDPAELLGYFRGTPLTLRTHDQIDLGPDMIFLYQEAIEDEARCTGLSVRQVVRETLWHEIAHYFGFSEEEMDCIEALWAEEEG
ncbi:putative Zn-dependent protease with MMP-like domain [Geothermobacter ehrlichii]|uniref:Putative Zn-dependent protease with MMP-like domain n=1 Tax=Geothermobacter ehrlichii TaxID=213224 RepID=A0A5D3WKH6_9BACT|nr:metallopeptidase family protein [Geothermobacter ehrlichii]TYO98888.1 putative Zn-dependent protease with MMP-like domain [Geothermobacter ehrlichii]